MGQKLARSTPGSPNIQGDSPLGPDLDKFVDQFNEDLIQEDALRRAQEQKEDRARKRLSLTLTGTPSLSSPSCGGTPSALTNEIPGPPSSSISSSATSVAAAPASPRLAKKSKRWKTHDRKRMSLPPTSEALAQMRIEEERWKYENAREAGLPPPPSFEEAVSGRTRSSPGGRPPPQVAIPPSAFPEDTVLSSSESAGSSPLTGNTGNATVNNKRMSAEHSDWDGSSASSSAAGNAAQVQLLSSLSQQQQQHGNSSNGGNGSGVMEGKKRRFTTLFTRKDKGEKEGGDRRLSLAQNGNLVSGGFGTPDGRKHISTPQIEVMISPEDPPFSQQQVIQQQQQQQSQSQSQSQPQPQVGGQQKQHPSRVSKKSNSSLPGKVPPLGIANGVSFSSSSTTAGAAGNNGNTLTTSASHTRQGSDGVQLNAVRKSASTTTPRHLVQQQQGQGQGQQQSQDQKGAGGPSAVSPQSPVVVSLTPPQAPGGSYYLFTNTTTTKGKAGSSVGAGALVPPPPPPSMTAQGGAGNGGKRALTRSSRSSSSRSLSHSRSSSNTAGNQQDNIPPPPPLGQSIQQMTQSQPQLHYAVSQPIQYQQHSQQYSQQYSQQQQQSHSQSPVHGGPVQDIPPPPLETLPSVGMQAPNNSGMEMRLASSSRQLTADTKSASAFVTRTGSLRHIQVEPPPSQGTPRGESGLLSPYHSSKQPSPNPQYVTKMPTLSSQHSSKQPSPNPQHSSKQPSPVVTQMVAIPPPPLASPSVVKQASPNISQGVCLASPSQFQLQSPQHQSTGSYSSPENGVSLPLGAVGTAADIPPPPQVSPRGGQQQVDIPPPPPPEKGFEKGQGGCGGPGVISVMGIVNATTPLAQQQQQQQQQQQAGGQQGSSAGLSPKSGGVGLKTPEPIKPPQKLNPRKMIKRRPSRVTPFGDTQISQQKNSLVLIQVKHIKAHSKMQWTFAIAADCTGAELCLTVFEMESEEPSDNLLGVNLYQVLRDSGDDFDPASATKVEMDELILDAISKRWTHNNDGYFVVLDDPRTKRGHMLRASASKPIVVDIEANGGDGRWIGENEIEWVSKISSGSFARVYKGIYGGKYVAIKMLKGKLDEKTITEFRKEFRVMKELHHPNLVECFGACYENDHLSYVMEYCPRGTLVHLMNEPHVTITWANIAEFFEQACKGLRYLHEHTPQVLHRDLKSQNILLTRDYQVKIGDFGLSRFNTASNGNSMSSMCGTMTHCAPEIFNCVAFTTKSDIYSMGMILWELANRVATGSYLVPFKEYSFISIDLQIIINAAHKDLRPTIKPEVPPKIAEIIRRCWAKAPADRPEAAEIIEMLQDIPRVRMTQVQSSVPKTPRMLSPMQAPQADPKTLPPPPSPQPQQAALGEKAAMAKVPDLPPHPLPRQVPQTSQNTIIVPGNNSGSVVTGGQEKGSRQVPQTSQNTIIVPGNNSGSVVMGGQEKMQLPPLPRQISSASQNTVVVPGNNNSGSVTTAGQEKIVVAKITDAQGVPRQRPSFPAPRPPGSQIPPQLPPPLM